jgi:hypothetical protein
LKRFSRISRPSSVREAVRMMTYDFIHCTEEEKEDELVSSVRHK